MPRSGLSARYTPKQRAQIVDTVGREYIGGKKSIEEILAEVGVKERTFFLWVSKNAPLAASWGRWRERAQAKMAAIAPFEVMSRITKSMGDYFVTEHDVIQEYDPQGNLLARRTRTSRKYIPVNTNQVNTIAERLALLNAVGDTKITLLLTPEPPKD
jgi:hypothetical protein